jgi:hypothetical protein
MKRSCQNVAIPRQRGEAAATAASLQARDVAYDWMQLWSLTRGNQPRRGLSSKSRHLGCRCLERGVFLDRTVSGKCPRHEPDVTHTQETESRASLPSRGYHVAAEAWDGAQEVIDAHDETRYGAPDVQPDER